MATTAISYCIQGMDAVPVETEALIIEGHDQMSIIGLADQAVKESADRITAAITSSGFRIPKNKLIINLAPGDLKKRGAHYDLAITIALLTESGQIRPLSLSDTALIGEFSLNGNLRPVNGVLPMVIKAKSSGLAKILVPAENLPEALLVKGIDIYGIRTLREAVELLQGNNAVYKFSDTESIIEEDEKHEEELDFADVRGQKELVNAVVLAAAGGHNMLMIGSPGCGKSMIAKRIPTILPPMTEDEQLEVTKIHSIAGLLLNKHSLITTRPFRSPHHNASLNALIGGGVSAVPGEVSLAHNGVLFLDEIAEFSRRTLDALRQPLEDKHVTISRVSGTNTYPSSFMFVAAMNPCPCGFYPDKRCRCTDYEVTKYRNSLSGPLMDRIDIQKWVKPVSFFDIADSEPSPSSAELREKVIRARLIQQERLKDYPGINCNAELTGSLIEKFCVLDHESMDILAEASRKAGWSARVIKKLLTVARTAADIRGSEHIDSEDVIYALSIRDLDTDNQTMEVV